MYIYYMKYNIYLSSPQLAVNATRKKYYKQIIEQNSINMNKNINKYSPTYFTNAYSSIYTPNKVIIPN
jgi:hypothetical protein